MIPSLEELRKRLVPVVGPDSASNSIFKRNRRLSTTPTRSDLPLPSDSSAPQHLSAAACHHSTAQTAPAGDRSAVEHPAAEIGVGSSHSDDQIVQDLAGGNCPQRRLFRFRRPAADVEDENPTKQRRYFVKEGLFVDHENEKRPFQGRGRPMPRPPQPVTCAGDAVKGMPERLQVDLKTLFPKLSLR
jgi:hypothetical protein